MLTVFKRHYFLALLLAIGMVYPVIRMAIKSFATIGLLVPLGFIMVWLVWRAQRPARPLVTPLGLPLLVCSATLVLSSLLDTSPRDQVLAMLFHWGAVAVLLFLCGDILANGCPPRYFAIAAIGMSSFALLVGFVQVGGWVSGWALLWRSGEALLPVSYRKFLVGSQPNQSVMLFYLGLPFVIGAWWQATRRWHQWVWAAWMLIATILIFVTGSRGGWLATGSVLGIILGPLLICAIREHAWRRIGWTLSLAAFYGTIFGALLLANQQSLEAQRGGSLFNPTGRTLFWERAIQLFSERPLLGAGPTGYAVFYNAVEPSSRLFRPGHAHNIYLMTLSEMGIIGSGALLLLGAVAMRIWWRGWRQSPPLASRPAAQNEQKLLMLGCVAALGGLAVHGLVDVPVPQISGMALYLAAAGLASGGGWRLARTANDDESDRWHWPHPLHLSVAFMALVAWGLSSFIFINDRRADWIAAQEQQMLALPQNQLEQAFDRYTVMLTADPADDSAYRVWAMALARLADNNRSWLPDAIAAQTFIVEHNPADYAAPVNRAALLIRGGYATEATDVLERFIATDTSNWSIPWLLMADMQEQQGNPAASASWSEMLRRAPDLADSAACRRSKLCATLPRPSSDAAMLRQLQPQIDRHDPAVLDQLATLAQRRLSVDLWATGAIIASDMGDEHATQRFLRAAVDQSQMIGSAPTRLLGLAQLRDALRRNDRGALPGLVSHWAIPADTTLVPQIGALTTTEIDRQIALAALEAAQRIDDERLLQQAQGYQGTVLNALAALPTQQAVSR